MNVFVRRAAPWACAWMLGVQAVQAAGTAPPEQVPPAPFDRYRPWRDEPLEDWRKANDHVGEIGGWRTYVRESMQGGDEVEQGGHDHHGPSEVKP